jgi:hypothetical protein
MLGIKKKQTGMRLYWEHSISLDTFLGLVLGKFTYKPRTFEADGAKGNNQCNKKNNIKANRNIKKIQRKGINY